MAYTSESGRSNGPLYFIVGGLVVAVGIGAFIMFGPPANTASTTTTTEQTSTAPTESGGTATTTTTQESQQ